MLNFVNALFLVNLTRSFELFFGLCHRTLKLAEPRLPLLLRVTEMVNLLCSALTVYKKIIKRDVFAKSNDLDDVWYWILQRVWLLPVCFHVLWMASNVEVAFFLLGGFAWRSTSLFLLSIFIEMWSSENGEFPAISSTFVVRNFTGSQLCPKTAWV